MIRITADQLHFLAPNARSSYRDAFQEANAILIREGINQSNLRIAHFMAQVLHETGGLRTLEEDLNYSAKRLTKVWPNRFKDIKAAEPFAHNPEKLANNVYGGRMGNTRSGDGWRYRGRGLLQLTGCDSYEAVGNSLGIDLVGVPDLALSRTWCLPIAADVWRRKRCNPLADEDNLRKVTLAINGGTTGLSDRRDWLAKTKKVWP